MNRDFLDKECPQISTRKSRGGYLLKPLDRLIWIYSQLDINFTDLIDFNMIKVYTVLIYD